MTNTTTSKASETSVQGNRITRCDEHGNVTTWDLLSEFREVSAPGGVQAWEADAISEFNGANRRRVVCRMPAAIVLAYHMAR